MIGALIAVPLILLLLVLLMRGGSATPPPLAPVPDRVLVASAPPPPPAAEQAPESNITVPERTPEATPAPAASPAPEASPTPEGETSLVLTVVEQGSLRPLPGAWTTLAIDGNNLDPVRANSTGTVEVARPAPGEYTATVRWGFGPEHVVDGITVVNGQITRTLIEYPRRKAFQFQLVDAEEKPLAGKRLKVGLSLYDEIEPTARAVEDVTTDGTGKFTLLGYDGIRPTLIGSEEPMVFRLRRGGRGGDFPPGGPGGPGGGATANGGQNGRAGAPNTGAAATTGAASGTSSAGATPANPPADGGPRGGGPPGGFGGFRGFGGFGPGGGPPDGGGFGGFGGGPGGPGGPGGGRWGRSWSNPMVNFRALDEENVTVIEAKGGMVRATATLVNAPDLPKDRGFHASVDSPSARYALIPIVDNKFTFFAEPGEEVDVELFRTNYAVTGEEIVKGPGGPPPWMGASREKEVTVKMPEEAGDHEFDIVFEDRLLVKGLVTLSTGEPVENVDVRIRGFNMAGAAAGASSEASGFGPPPGGGPGGPGGNNPDSNFLAPKTNRDGEFEIALPPAGEYLFSPDRDSLPEGWRGFVSETREWRKLQSGEPVIITLEASSLIWGEVVDERKKPVEGAIVRLQGRGIPGSVRNMTATTDIDGLFSLNIPPLKDIVPKGANTAQGDYFVRATRDDYGIGMAPVVADDPDQSVTIVVYKQTHVYLKPTSAGEAVRSIQVSVLYDVDQFESAFTAGRRYVRRTDDLGIADLQLLPRGITTIIVSAISGEGNAVGPTREVVVPADADEEVTLSVDLTPEEGDAGGTAGGTGGGRRGGGRAGQPQTVVTP